jgi:ATP-dependent RNA helicase MSS116, mitochondrial
MDRGDHGDRGDRGGFSRRNDPFGIDVTRYTDEQGNQVELKDDMAEIADFDPEELEISKTEATVGENEFSGYKPVHWLNYKGKIDDGFIESMKSVFQYAHLTEVQDALVSRVPLQNDLLVRSKTGTGKTLAFLIPAIQRHIDHMKTENLNPRMYPKTHAGTLIVTPTRELAIQIANEARRLIFPIQPSGMKVQVLVGGDSKREQIRRMDRERNDILIGTPGRLLDFLKTEPGINDVMMSIRTLIFDEADNLLDMGFRKDMELLLSYLEPTDKQRRNMMFSATISSEIQRFAEKALNHDVEFINTVKAEDLDVHQKVQQTYILRDAGDRLKVVLSLIIKEQLEKPGGKVIVFFNTTKEVQLYTLLFRYLRRLYANPHFQQFEIHSKKTQEQRTKVNHAFRTANVGSVLFTTDVSYHPPFPLFQPLLICLQSPRCRLPWRN